MPGTPEQFNLVSLVLNLITLGGLAVVGVTTYRVSRRKGIDAAEEKLVAVLKDELAAVRGRANRLQDESEYKDETIKELASRPDQTALVSQVTKFHGELLDRLDRMTTANDARYTEGMAKIHDRFDDHGKILERVAETLDKIERRLERTGTSKKRSPRTEGATS